MGVVTWIAIGVIVLVAIGLGGSVFFGGLLRGATIVAQNPVVQNATHEAAKAAENTQITSTSSVVSVQPVKTVYTTSEPVVIIIKNTGNDKIVIPDSKTQLKLTNQDNGKTYIVTVPEDKSNVAPGDSITITWDEHDSSGNTVDTGRYNVNVQTEDQTSIGQTAITIQN